jgi:hypothetical protein
MKKKAVSRKKKAAVKKVSGKKAAARKKAPAKKASAHKAPKKKASSKKAAPARKKKTNSRAHTRATPPSSRPQPVPPGNEQPAQIAGEDEHGPMHIPSHKPTPAYAQMHQNDWAGKPPQHDIPVPKH